MSCVHPVHGAPEPESVNEGEGEINSLRSQSFGVGVRVGGGVGGT